MAENPASQNTVGAEQNPEGKGLFDRVAEPVRAMEKEIGLRPGFLEGLPSTADDWTFVIKCAALAEASLSYLIPHAIQKEGIEDFVERMQVGGRTGMIELAASLSLFDKPRLTFLRTLFALRNSFVHDVRNAASRIEDVVAARDAGNQQAFWRDIAHGHSPSPTMYDFGGEAMPSEEFARRHPRFMLWISTMRVVGMAYQVKTW